MRLTDLTCEWCKKKFKQENSRGRPPKFCCVAHRQRAFESREKEKLVFMVKHLKNIMDNNGTAAKTSFAKGLEAGCQTCRAIERLK